MHDWIIELNVQFANLLTHTVSLPKLLVKSAIVPIILAGIRYAIPLVLNNEGTHNRCSGAVSNGLREGQLPCTPK